MAVYQAPRVRLARTLSEHWPLVAIAPLLSTASYQLLLWSIAQAPVAFVVSLRETSMLFAVGIGALLLRERVGAWRWLAVSVVAGGVVAIRLATH
jgi:drug/metabolite transporter (DMT)-like permease